MPLTILGLGTAVPATHLTQEHSAGIAQRICARSPDQREFLGSLHNQTGIAGRHMAFSQALVEDILNETALSGSPFLPGGAREGPTTAQRMEHYVAHAGPLALEACRKALAEADLAPAAISHLVTVSCTGFNAPGVDAELLRGLGLRQTVERTHIGFMGCHGALNGLRVARAYAEADPRAVILVSAVELCGVHYAYGWDPKRMVANALFADGAAAVAGRAGPPGEGLQAVASGACIFPDTAYAMTWSVGDHGFEMSLSTRVPELIARNLKPWIEEWLSGCGLGLGDIAGWAVHPGGPRILTAVEEALGLDRQATADSWGVLHDHGNMSSPTVLFVLDRARRRPRTRPCVALGFGPGLAVEAALFG